MNHPLSAVIALAVTLMGCAYTGASSDGTSQLPLSPREEKAAAIAADTMRTYAIAARCAQDAYADHLSTAPYDTIMLRLRELGVIPATAPSQPVASHIAQLLADARRNTPGFKAQVFYDSCALRYIIAYAGTEPEGADIITDIDGAFSITEPQNAQALALLDSVTLLIDEMQAHNPSMPHHSLLLTGHSLGGRLASIGSITRGVDAVVFNPANIPFDLQRDIESDSELASNADNRLRRIHSAADQLTGGVDLARELRPLIPYISAAMSGGKEWLDDRSTLSALKSVLSSAPEIAGAAAAVWDWVSPSESATPDASAASLARIVVEVVAHARKYGVSADDLNNPLFYQYRGRSVTLPYATGPHSIDPLALSIDSAYTSNSHNKNQ